MLLLRRGARAAGDGGGGGGDGGEMSAAASANRSGRRGRAGVGARAPWRRLCGMPAVPVLLIHRRKLGGRL